MLRRIGFRRLLPIVFLFAHAALLVFSPEQSQSISSSEGSKADRFFASSQGNSIVWQPMEPQQLTPEQRIAMVVNLPAMILAIPIAIAFFQGSPFGLMYAGLLFVPLVWYGVGRWLDRLFGFIPQSPKLHKTSRKACAVLSAFVLTMSVLGLTPVNHHRRRPNTYVMGFSLVLWSGLFLAMSASGSVRLGDRGLADSR
jgi:hypothetical protein